MKRKKWVIFFSFGFLIILSAVGYGYDGGGTLGGGYCMLGGCTEYSLIEGQMAQVEMADSLLNAKIDKANNTITYIGKTVKIVMFAGPEAADDKFVIGGLINPVLRIPQGADVTFELINEDEQAPHGLEIILKAPPYTYMPMMQREIYPGTLINPIPKAASGGYPVAQAFFKAGLVGTYYYICQYPGHAAEGMFGKIIIGD